MRIAYFDGFAGASGDMILGALLDAGLDPEALNAAIAGLGLKTLSITAEPCLKNGIRATRARVHAEETATHRHYTTIESIIDSSQLERSVKRKSKAVFLRLGEVEAGIHGVDLDKIHFHEVGALDAIADIIGAVAGLALLGVEQVYCAPLNVGSGVVACAHGTLPVPAPAALELLKGVPVYSLGQPAELVTPTGAAILTTLAKGFGPLPGMRIERIGYGAGQAELDLPNLLRLVIGEAADG